MKVIGNGGSYRSLSHVRAWGQPSHPQPQPPPLPLLRRTTRLTAKNTAAATMSITIIVCHISYISKEPIWKNNVLTIQARPMVYTTVKSAHFHLPLSFLMATTVLMQGM